MIDALFSQPNYLVAQKALDGIALRHEAIARNIANLDTPGYKRMDHLPAELSGGEQQRIAIARALVNAPALLLADEPCANLDSRASTMVLDLIASINRELGQTVLMVSHEEAHRRYFGREVRLYDGRLAEEGEAVR